MNKYAEYKEIYKGLIKEAILGIGEKEDGESTLATNIATGLSGLGGATLGGLGSGLAATHSGMGTKGKALAAALGALGGGALSGVITNKGLDAAAEMDNPALSYLTTLLTAPPLSGVAANISNRWDK